MTKDLAQVNVTLTEITQHTEILFTLASFQVSISQLRHQINIISGRFVWITNQS